MTAINTSVTTLNHARKDIYLVYTKDMYIAILGRQPALGMAELERIYGSTHTGWLAHNAAFVTSDSFALSRLGGTQKAGFVTHEFSHSNWQKVSTTIVQHYTKAWAQKSGKLTLGLSAYGFTVSARDVQKIGLIIKQNLKKAGVSVRLIPNTEPLLSSATAHHNKLGLAENKIELIIARTHKGMVVAESIGAQNITALALRDQKRPKRDAFVGMLPPKLAQMMVNLAVGNHPPQKGGIVLDPFCGTGVILQEAALMGFDVYGSDLEQKMIDYTEANLQWLLTVTPHLASQSADKRHYQLEQGDAMVHTWHPTPTFVSAESYLGQPFSAPPSPAKLQEVKNNCNHIIGSFLKNIAGQLISGTPLVLAVPAWRGADGSVTHLPLTRHLNEYGFTPYQFSHVSPDDLLYYRENQVVARELLVLVKT